MSTIVAERQYKPMKRGKSQVLFNYLPGKTFDITGGTCIAEVKQIIGKEVALSNKNRLLRLIKDYVEQWEPDYRPDFRFFDTMRDSFVIKEPLSVKYDIFPLTFKCYECGRVFNYRDYAELERKNPNLTCQSDSKCAGERLHQMYQVAIHTCGNLQGLYPLKPRECTCDDKYLKFDERRSQKATDFRWICTNCGREREMEYRCTRCFEADKNMEVVPHRASKCYHVHHLRCVDVPECRNPREREEALKVYLDITVDSDAYAKMLAMIKNSAISSPEVIEKLNSMFGNENMAQFELSSIPPDVADAVYEFVKVNEDGDIEMKTFEELAGEIRPFDSNKSHVLEENASLFREIGIKDVYLVENFPVITAVFGWSRLHAQPQNGQTKVRLHSFKNGSDTKGKVPIYVDNGKCEGLMFRLDTLETINWLRDNGIEVNLSMEDEQHAKYWLLQNMEKINPLHEPVEGTVTHYIYSLIHSMSHITMKAISGISGFELQGLAEYLFPETLSFVIYSNKTDFIIGGMYTLFEEQADLLKARMVSRDISICMHDPLCKEQKGACHACLFLPEISCCNFNKSLNRNFVFGFEDKKGYWEDKIL